MLIDQRVTVAALSLAAAALLGTGGVLTRRGLRHGTVAQSLFLTFGTSTVLVVTFDLVTGALTLPPLGRTAIFVGDGLLNFLSVFCIFTGVARVGATMSYTIKNASPLVALAFAIVLLGERPTVGVYVGAVLATGGIVLMSAGTGAGRWRFERALGWPAAATVLVALDNVVRRAALQMGVPAMTGLAIALPSSLVLATIWARSLGPLIPACRSSRFNFIGAGVCQGLALTSLYAALRMGTVSVVTPLYTSSPVFVLLLAWVTGTERPTLRVALSVVAVVLGVGLVASSG